MSCQRVAQAVHVEIAFNERLPILESTSPAGQFVQAKPHVCASHDIAAQPLRSKNIVRKLETILVNPPSLSRLVPRTVIISGSCP